MPTSPPLTHTSIVQWSTAPVATEVDHEVVLMHLERSRCYGLGETGSAIWRRLREATRVDELCHQLSAEYEAEPVMLLKDVLELLEQLRAEGLIEVLAG